MGRGRSKKKDKKGDDKSSKEKFYFKVLATFQCSRDNCNRSWSSAHAWERDDEGTICEVCETEAGFVNAVDEMLKLDTYQCPKQSCKMFWQTIHDGNRTPQQCDCGTMVPPEPSPQERFGRHYTFKCKNKSCGEKPEWEDFSMEQQKTQRCATCGSRGDIRKVQKLGPWWMEKRRREQLLLKKGGVNASNGNLSGGRVELGRGKGPSKHNSSFCEMCQDIIHQGKGRSCHNFRMIVSRMTEDVSSGSVDEKIVHVQ